MNKSLLVAALALVAGGVQAQGHWMVKPGVTVVQPQNGHSDLLGTVPATVTTDWEPSVSLEYLFNKNWAVEVLAAAPFEHYVNFNIPNSKITHAARFKDLPPTVSVKYRYPLAHGITPYAGLGLNYTLIWGEKLNTYYIDYADGGTQPLKDLTGKLKAKDSFGVALMLGTEYKIPNTKFGVFGDVRWISLNSKLKYNGTDIGKLDVNPWVYTVGFSYVF